ncbi:MAG TPA: hypothetical protein VM369_01310 [Candidatus Binatia bacterium]|nr:hypothetical protein [Candidatus Binatia bacterium]
MKTVSKKPIALAIGAAFALTGVAAQASLFQAAELGTGYMVAGDAKVEGEVKCGAACVKAKTDGGMKEADAKAACDKMAKEGKCGGDKNAAGDKKKDGKCGEGKCGAKK